jgi:hypothetical protein
MANTDRTRNTSSDWTTEESFWREHYRTRPYVQPNRSFDDYRPAYRYGFESANRIGTDRSWTDAEPELRSGWDRYEGRSQSTWEEVKESVRDAWDRITGSSDHPNR